MDELGYHDKIFYFKEEGKMNISKTAELSIRKAKEEGISKILVFTGDGEGPLELRKQLGNEKQVNIIAVTFPNLMPFFQKEGNGEIKEFFPKTSYTELKEVFNSKNIKLVQGVMPFEDVVIPGARDSKVMTIKEALGLFSGGLKLCVQASLMATDSGAIKPGEKVISMSADTSIITNGANSNFLFHPIRGLKINKVICKPLTFQDLME